MNIILLERGLHMWGIDIKKRIEDAVIVTVNAYREEKGLSDKFLNPIIGYASANNPLFQTFFDLNWTMHPKEIYRPGNTVIIHFLPFTSGVIESNRSGGEPSKEWVAAYESAIMLSAHINGCIKQTLEDLGRLASLTNLPNDWNEERDGPDWSHKLAAYVAGMGDFGIAGSFNTSAGSAGRFGSLITDCVIEPSKHWTEAEMASPEIIADSIEKSCLFAGSGGADISENVILRCPAGAINIDGVDRMSCRKYCAEQQQIVPASDVCGKCFD